MKASQDSREINELAKWLSKVAIRYDKPILFVIAEFTKAMDMYLDCNLAKMYLIKQMSMKGAI